MSSSERRKGVRGEREVLETFMRHGFAVRGLEGSGDHLALIDGLVVHVESKRQETARPWAWWEQASSETPPGALTVVAFRRSRSSWLALVSLEELVAELGRRGVAA